VECEQSGSYLAGSAWRADRDGDTVIDKDGLGVRQAMNYRTSCASSRDKSVVKNVVLLIFFAYLIVSS